MQLLIVDSYTFLPKQLVEGYSSLIWTERYVAPGDFELIVADPNVVNLLPNGTLLTINGSFEVAIVETHETKINPNGHPETTIRGRTVDGVLDNRIIWGPHGAALTLPRAYTYRDAALMYIWSSVVNTLPADVAYTVDRPPVLYGYSPIPNVIVTDSTVQEPTTLSQFSVNMGSAGDSVRTWLGDSDLGLRTIRPGKDEHSKKVMVVTTNGTDKGLVTKIDGSNFAELRLDVYSGVDRSTRQSVVPQISFLGAAGHLTDIQILDTDTVFTTDLVITTPVSTYNFVTPYTAPPNGFARRIEYIDGSSLIENVAVGNDQSIVIAAYQRQYFAEHAGEGILSAGISKGTPYKYGVDYFMGDIMTLSYGFFERVVRVTEYTKVEDRNGQHEYPTFTAIPY